MMLTSISMPRGSFHPPADVVVEVLFGTLGSGTCRRHADYLQLCSGIRQLCSFAVAAFRRIRLADFEPDMEKPGYRQVDKTR